jgi:uncharacterized membrane protein YbhN (UPF0104 family)
MSAWRAARLATGPVVLVAVAVLVDPGRLLGYLVGLDPVWLLPIVGLSLIQFGVSAWRWRFTAQRLGLALTRRQALADYYVAVLLNQCLPGGVLGDANRAWRHARAAGNTVGAAQAVLLERVSGQLAMAVVALLSVPAVPGIAGAVARHPWLTVSLGAFGLLAVGLALGHAWWRPGAVLPRALLGKRVWPIQLGTSLVVVATYIGIYALAARSLGVDRSLLEVVPLIPFVLLAMLVPLSVAGWGVREGAAGALWLASGWPAAEGVAVSVAYGALNLVLALPGLAVVLARFWAGSQGGSGGLFRRRSRSNRTSSPS